MAEVKAVALSEGTGLDDSGDGGGATISCPHCGAPVKYAAPDMTPAPPPPAPGPAAAPGGDDGDAMDEAGGDADGMDTAAGLEGDAAMDDTELAEDVSDADHDGDPSIEHIQDKTEGVEADEDASLDDSVEADEEAGLDEDASLDEDAALDDDAALEEDSVAAGPKRKVAMAGIKLPGKPPVSGGAHAPVAGAPPAAKKPTINTPQTPQPNPGNTQALREIRSLRAATAKLEKQIAANERRERVRKGRSLLSRGLREGKLTKKMVGTPQAPTFTRRFAMRDPVGFSDWLRNEAPIVVDLKERGTALAEEQTSSAALAQRIDQLARQKMRTNPSLDYKSATLEVHSENRSLSEQYDRSMSGTGPRHERVLSRRSSVR